MSDFSPREIVSELDRYIVGQVKAKRAVAIALRNRWRRRHLSEPLREEVTPKNILMIGPTGVGKTEISRRLARLANAPFLKVEATKFTEVGYVGRDVEQIIRDLLETAINMIRQRKHKQVEAQAHLNAENRVLDALVGEGASSSTRENFRSQLRSGALDEKEIELEVTENKPMMLGQELFNIPGMHASVMNFSDLFSKALGGAATRRRRIRVSEAHPILISEECDKLIDEQQIIADAIEATQDNGIIFLDEIDKICSRGTGQGASADISREGVQRDLLPLIEGATVSTRHGSVQTDHILFIASGAFHATKPSDLLPELQGRLPIRVELEALTRDDFRRILTEPEANLIRQYQALMETENVKLEFTEDAIDALANISVDINTSVENIGARRLHTVMERVLEDTSFTATDKSGEAITVDADFVERNLGALARDADISRFIL